MIDPPLHTSEARLVSARDALAETLAELQHRVAHARAAISLSRYLESPWLRLGAAIVVGYVAGAAADGGAARGLARRVAVFAATAIVRDALGAPAHATAATPER